MTGGGGAAAPRAIVVGPGAVGSFLGATLALAGWEVTLVGRTPRPDDPPAAVVLETPRRLLPARAAAAPAPADAPSGLPAAAPAGLPAGDGTGDGSGADAGGRPGPTAASLRVALPVRRAAAAEAAALPVPEVVILAVKAYDVAEALRTAAAWPGVPIVTAQNGIGAEPAALAARRGAVIAASLTTAVEPIPGGVRRRRRGGIGIAVARDDAARSGTAIAERLATAWRRGGLPARIHADAATLKWSKLLTNLVANATSAILDLDPRTIYGDPAGYEVERRQLAEAEAVVRALAIRPVGLQGAPLPLLLLGLRLPAALVRPVAARAIGRARGGKAPSLRLGLRGALPARSEIDWLNGAVVAEGRRLGIPVPVNAALVALVREVGADPGRAAELAGRPDRLLDEVARAAG